MELEKLTAAEVRNQDATTMMETEEKLREEITLLNLRAPLVQEGTNVSRRRKIKRSLAILLTVMTERENKRNKQEKDSKKKEKGSERNRQESVAKSGARKRQTEERSDERSEERG